MRCAILESRPLARAHLARAIQRHASVKVEMDTESVSSLLSICDADAVDVIFLDADHSELEIALVALREMGERAPASVMIGDYPDRALEAYDRGACDFLLRPIEATRLAVSIQRLQQLLANRQAKARAALLEEALADLRERAASVGTAACARDFWVSGHGARVRIGQSEIVWLEAARGYVYFHLRSRKLLERMTMKQLEARLDPDRFLRVHRSAIVNVDEIAAALRDRHGLYAVELTNGARVRVGRKYRDGLSELIQQTQARPRAEDAAA